MQEEGCLYNLTKDRDIRNNYLELGRLNCLSCKPDSQNKNCQGYLEFNSENRRNLQERVSSLRMKQEAKIIEEDRALIEFHLKSGFYQTATLSI